MDIGVCRHSVSDSEIRSRIWNKRVTRDLRNSDPALEKDVVMLRRMFRQSQPIKSLLGEVLVIDADYCCGSGPESCSFTTDEI